MYLYVDGALDVFTEASGRINGGSYNLLLGENEMARTTHSGDRSFNGFLDDVRIYDYPLPDAEIAALYAGREFEMRRK